MAELDSVILGALDSAGLADHALIGGVDHIGAFADGFVEVGSAESIVAARQISFRTRISAQVRALSENDSIIINGATTYRMLRVEPPGGDESGQVVILLGSVI